MVAIRITVKVPEIILNSRYVRFEIERKMRNKTGPEIRTEFRKTVNGWKEPPDFQPSYRNSTAEVSTTVRPVGKGTTKYGYVNNGTEPHLISARRAPVLRFKAFYQASTWPRVIRSQPSRRFGPWWIAKQVTQHTEAREFDLVIAEEYADTFVNDMQDAIAIATVKSEGVSK